MVSVAKSWFTHLNFRSITGGFIYNFNSSESFLKIVKTTEKKIQKKVSGIASDKIIL